MSEGQPTPRDPVQVVTVDSDDQPNARESTDPDRATLVLGVGHRAESVITTGALEALLEQAMARVAADQLETAVHVGKSTTTVTAEGPHSQVMAYLGGLCTQLGDLAKNAAEPAPKSGARPPEAAVLLLRFGHQDLGLGLTSYKLPAETLQRSAEQYFVASNALVVVAGPEPEDLDLSLPRGKRNLAMKNPCRFSQPQALCLASGVVALSLVLPAPARSEVNRVTEQVLRRRLAGRLADIGGPCHDVGGEGHPAAADRWVVTAYARPELGREDEASRALVGATQEICRTGPTPGEVSQAIRAVLEQLSDPPGRRDIATSKVTDTWFGLQHIELSRESLHSVTTADVTHRLRHVRDDLCFELSEGSEDFARRRGLAIADPEPAVHQVGGGTSVRSVRPRWTVRLADPAAVGVRLVADDDCLWLDTPGYITKIHKDDLVGLIDNQKAKTLTVFGRDGTTIHVGEAFAGRSTLIENLRTWDSDKKLTLKTNPT